MIEFTRLSFHFNAGLENQIHSQLKFFMNSNFHLTFIYQLKIYLMHSFIFKLESLNIKSIFSTIKYFRQKIEICFLFLHL